MDSFIDPVLSFQLPGAYLISAVSGFFHSHGMSAPFAVTFLLCVGHVARHFDRRPAPDSARSGASLPVSPSQIDETWVSLINGNIRLHMGVDGISLWLILLTTVLVPIAVWATEKDAEGSPQKLLCDAPCCLSCGLIGVFSALDPGSVLSFLGSRSRPHVSDGRRVGRTQCLQSFGEVFRVHNVGFHPHALGSILYLHSLTHSFDYVDIIKSVATGQLSLSARDQMLIFFGFLAAFAVKAPIFPLHTWLPNTYAEAPMPATFLLAAVMSKMGTYGLIRFAITLAPGAAHRFAPWIAVCAIIGIVNRALLALVQSNIKRLIAYSSLSHIGFIVLGIFSFNQQAADGAVFQMLAHGISTGALFLLAGYLEVRRHSLEIADFGGVAALAPRLAAAFSIALFASIGLPALCNFVGEFLILQGAAIADFHWAIWAALGVIFSAAYMLWMYQRTLLGKLNPAIEHFQDLQWRDWVPTVPLILLMVWLGCYSQSFMPSISASTNQLLDNTNMNNQYRVKLDASGSPLAEVLHAR